MNYQHYLVPDFQPPPWWGFFIATAALKAAVISLEIIMTYRQYQASATQVADFLAQFYKPERYTERGDGYAASLLERCEQEFGKQGYCFISHQDSVTRKLAAYFGPDPGIYAFGHFFETRQAWQDHLYLHKEKTLPLIEQLIETGEFYHPSTTMAHVRNWGPVIWFSETMQQHGFTWNWVKDDWTRTETAHQWLLTHREEIFQQAVLGLRPRPPGLTDPVRRMIWQK